MIGWKPTITSWIVLLITATVLAQQSNAQRPWHYTIGEQKINQQANFCLKKKAVYELARIFEKEGARPGYTALDRKCSTKIESFTLEKIIRQVTIATSAGDQYTISFVKVQTIRGDIQYLVTTRDVLEKN